jgi:hypothetical protein
VCVYVCLIVGDVETSIIRRPARVGLLRQRKKILQSVMIVRKAETIAPYRSELAANRSPAPTALRYEILALYLHSPMRH